MTLPVAFPSTIPGPTLSVLETADRGLHSNATEGPYETTPAQRDFGGVMAITFPTYTAAEAASFRAWWRTKLRRGGYWFAARWPTPEGLDVILVVRFVAPPHYKDVPNGYWKITGQVEVRGIGMLPRTESEVRVYTSWPYAALVADSADVGLAIPLGGLLVPIQRDAGEIGLVVPVSGTLDAILESYAQPPEEGEIGLVLPLSGTLDVVLTTYEQPPESADLGISIPLSGTINVVLVSYHAPPEEADLGLAIPLSGTLA